MWQIIDTVYNLPKSAVLINTINLSILSTLPNKKRPNILLWLYWAIGQKLNRNEVTIELKGRKLVSELEVRIGSMQHAEPGFSIHPRGELRNKETMSRAGWHSNLSKCSRTYYTNCAENITENIEYLY